MSSKQKRQLESLYEDQYYQTYKDIEPLKIVSIKTKLDFFPKKSMAYLKTFYRLKNKTDQPIRFVFVNINHRLKFNLSFSNKFYLLEKNKILGVYIYRFEEAIKPQSEIIMEYSLTFEKHGIFNSNFNTKNLQILKNGTSLSNTSRYSYFPYFGYKTKDLKNLYNIQWQKQSYLSEENPWIDFESILSTSSDQMAFAPGELIRSWKEKNRNYFHYKTHSPILTRYAFLSGIYSFQRERWKDINIEVYHHPDHHKRVSFILESIKLSLSYFAENFGPYPHNTFRIIEVPRYYTTSGPFIGQAFSSMMTVSEDLNFIYKVDQEGQEAFLILFAHELAHQWWPEQVIGARVRGSHFLSESFAEYSALMVLEKAYGLERVKRVLRYSLNRYLEGRKKYHGENPLISSIEKNVYYEKGGFLLYALKNLIGEKKLNSILKEFLNTYAYKGPPFPRSLEFIDLLKKRTHKKYHTFIVDSFERITFYKNRISNIECKKRLDGKILIKVKVIGEKLFPHSNRSIPKGDLIAETSLGISDQKGKWIYLEKHTLKTGENLFSVLINPDQEPYQLVLDPFYLFMDWSLNDNKILIRDEQSCLH